MVSPILQVKLLGGFSLTYGKDATIKVTSERLQSLIAYLILHREIPQPRQRLAFLLWPDSTDSQARTNLRRELHHLRRIWPDAEQFIQIDAKTLQWRSNSQWSLDVSEFEQTIAQAGTAEQRADSQGLRNALEQAVERYQGNLLPNSDREWIRLERERLLQAFMQVLEQLVSLLQSQRDYPAATRYGQLLLRIDPLHEATYSSLMQLQALSGDRAGALRVYHRCMTVLRDELGVDPSPAIRDLYHRLLNETDPDLTPLSSLDQRRPGQEDIRPAREPSSSQDRSQPDQSPIHPRVDWREAPDVSLFYGYTSELKALTHWILVDRCRLVTLLGMGGMGKTSIAVKLAQEIQTSFEVVIWRSLRHGPTLDKLLEDLLSVLSEQQETEAGLDRLLYWLQTCRCLLIFDNVETILLGEQRSGQYRSGYENYGDLLRLLGETAHQSCAVLTSREKPTEISALEGIDLPIRSLLISGSPEVSQALIQAKGLVGSEDQQQQLCQFYGHNPLALKVVATSIRDLFDGDISTFLSQNIGVFHSINTLLDQQFQRCSPLEQVILYWLAINREGTTIAELAEDIVPPVSRAELLAALESLRWRSLIEISSPRWIKPPRGSYTQQPAVMEYVTRRLVAQVSDEIGHGLSITGDRTQELSSPDDPVSMPLLNSHALLKAQGKDFVQDIQLREIVQPILQRLHGQFTQQTALEHQLLQIVARLQHDSPLQPGYAGGNILNLLAQLHPTLTGYDFSKLALWQANLRHVKVHGCNLIQADLSRTVFIEPLGLPLAIAFSPDGQLLATGDAKGAVRVWRVADGKTLLTCQGHTNWVWSVAWSPNGQTLASSSSDCTIKLWDLDTGQCRQTLQDHTAQVWAVAFSPNGQTLVSGSEDQRIRIWDVERGACIGTLEGHTDWIRSVAWSPNGQILASGCDDKTVKVWDMETGDCLQTLQGHTKRVWSVAFSPDGKTLASSSSDHAVKLWDLNTGTCACTLVGHQNWVRSLAFSPIEVSLPSGRGPILASGSEDQTVKLWNISTGECLQTLRDHRNWVRSVAFSPQGDLLASGSGDYTVKLWHVPTGQCWRTWQGYTNRIWCVAFSPDGKTLASAHDDHTVKLWEFNTSTCRRILSGHTNSVCAVAFSPNGQILASGSEDHTIKLWRLKTGQCLQTLSGHSGRIWSLAFSPNGPILASGSEDHTIKLWSIKTGQCLQTLDQHRNWVCAVAFSPTDRSTIASGSYDETIKVWNTNTGECCQTFTGHDNWVWSVAWSPDGQTLASGSGDHTIKLWDVQTGQCRHTLTGHDSRIWSVTFSHRGHLLASASSDRTVKLWDSRTGSCLHTLEGHTNLAWSVAFSPDDRTVASGSQDQTIALWEVQTGVGLTTLQPDRPYEGANLMEVTGITLAQKDALRDLGAIDQDPSAPHRLIAGLDGPKALSAATAAQRGQRPSALPPLVGQEAEWAAIQHWLGAAGQATDADFLLLIGESGIGKTRLLTELAAAAQDMQGQVLWGRSFQSDMGRPYGVWIDALRSHVDHPGQTLPSELTALFPPLETVGQTQIDRNRLFEAIAQLMAQLSSQREPLIVIFDDIQWLDEASTALLHYVIRLLRYSPVRFAGAIRQPDLGNNVPVCQLVQSLRRDHRIQILALSPLDRAQTAELIHWIDPGLDGDRIYTDSGGNPLFALEIARAIAEANTAYTDNLEAIIQDRLRQLDPSTRELLSWAATFGHRFRPTIVAQVAECPLMRLLAALSDLEQQGIIQPGATRQDEMDYEFIHDVVRQVAYADVSDPRRRLMHRHIAHTLQPLTSGDDQTWTSDIAYHAALGGDHTLAASASLTAAEHCLQLCAYADAAALARQGLEHCQGLDPPSRIRLHISLLKVYVLSGVTREQAVELEAQLHQLILEAEQLNLKDEEAIGLETLIALNYDQGHLTEVQAHSLQAVERGRAASSTTTARMLAYSGWCLADIGREMERAEALLFEANALAARTGLELMDISCGLGCVRRHAADFTMARLLMEQARQMADALQDHWRECVCLTYLAMIELEANNPSAALTYCQDLARVAPRLGETSEAVCATALDALARYQLMHADAKAALEQALVHLRQLDAQRMLAYTLTFAAQLDLDRGDADLALVRAQEALQAAQIVEQPTEVAMAWILLIRAHLAQDNPQQADAQFQNLQCQIDEHTLSARARSSMRLVAEQLEAQSRHSGGKHGSRSR